MQTLDYAEYTGKTYLVTGASGTIGQLCCRMLAERGAKVILLARNPQNLRKVMAGLPGENHIAMPFDLGNIVAIENLVASILAEAGQVAGVIYCVGNGDICRFGKLIYERLHAIMLPNFYGYIELIRAFYKQKERDLRMSIVGVSSLASSAPEKYFTAYAASKAAMESATRCMALESIARNMTIKMISPGVVASARVSSLGELTGDLEEKIKANGFQPMGLIPAMDVAAIAIFLLSAKAWYINGCAVPVNGAACC